MRVKLLCNLCSSHNSDGIVEVSDELAKSLITRGDAIPVLETPAPAPVPPAARREKAVIKLKEKRKR